MPIVDTDILYLLTGGASNADPNASLGGAVSSTQISGAANSLFDDVSAGELTAGDIEYRCIAVKNNHGSLALQNAVVWINQLTTSSDTEIDLGVDPAAFNVAPQTVANENTAPATGVTFTRPTTKGAGLTLGNIPAGQFKCVWVKRTVTAGGSAGSDSGSIRVDGETA